MPSMRTLLPQERGRIEAHLLRLGPSDRILRFNMHASDESIRNYVRNLPFTQCLNVAFEPDGEVRAMVQLIWDPGPIPVRAELAVTVEEAWRFQGVGSALVRRAILFARNRGFHSVHMVCLQHNQAMRQLARSVSGSLSYDEGDVAAEVILAPPNQLSIIQETVQASDGWVHGVLNAVRRLEFPTYAKIPSTPS